MTVFKNEKKISQIGSSFALREIKLKINHKTNHRILSMKASHPTSDTSYSLYTPCPISFLLHHIPSTHNAPFPLPQSHLIYTLILPHPPPPNPMLPFPVLPLTTPLHNNAPFLNPPLHHLYNYITYPLYKQSPSSTLLSGEVTWMMLCSSSELIQLHLTLSPCKINQSTSWVNQSLFPKNKIFILDIKSYTCLSNPRINDKNYVE